jgi:hypothetical protein
MVLGVMQLSSGVSLAAGEDVEHFKMLSNVEYSGKGQFKNQIETMFTVEKKLLFGGAFRKYSISTNDYDLISEEGSKALSFTIDKKTSKMSNANKELMLLQNVNNQCIGFLEKVTKDNVKKTWKQTFDLSPISGSIPKKLRFTVSAIPVKTEAFGEMIAVRALSDPFTIEATKKNGGKGSIKSRINAVYLFDSEVEDIYLSTSVLEAITNINGFKEILRHEVATYKTNAAGQPVDLTGLDKKFAQFIKRVGLAKKTFEVVNEVPLPLWAQSFAFGSAQAASISAGIACEGASNPVSMICLPTVRTFAMQSFGYTGPLASLAGLAGQTVPISSSLGAGVPAMAGMNIVGVPTVLGVPAVTAGAVAGGTTAAAVAAGGGSSGGGGTASP